MPNAESSKQWSNEASSAEERCPYCRDSLVEDELSTRCSYCKTLQHLDCVKEHGCCAVHACGNQEFLVGDQTLPMLALLELAQLSKQDLAEETRLDREWEQRLQGTNRLADLGHDPKDMLLDFVKDPVSVVISVAIVAGFGWFMHPVIFAGFLLMLVFMVLFSMLTYRWMVAKVEAESSHEGPHKTNEGPRQIRSTTLSFWHDVLGQDGFDPFTGMSAPQIVALPEGEELPDEGFPEAPKNSGEAIGDGPLGPKDEPD